MWQYTAIDVASAYTWASLHVTGRNPSAAWTSQLARQVAADLAARGWKPAFARYLTPNRLGSGSTWNAPLRYYNTERAHSGRWTNGRTPEAVLGKARLWHHNR